MQQNLQEVYVYLNILFLKLKRKLQNLVNISNKFTLFKQNILNMMSFISPNNRVCKLNKMFS